MVAVRIIVRTVRRMLESKMLVVLTGKMGSGKTTALGMFAELGYETLAMDEYVHQSYLKDNPGYNLILKNFGPDYVNAQEVDRKRLGQLVFNDRNSLNKLNEIMLPLMRDKIILLRNPNRTIIVELAIYINHQQEFADLFDKVILITGAKDVEKKNLKTKMGYTRKFPTSTVGNIKNPIKSLPVKCDYHVDNIQDQKFLENQIKKIAKKF